MASVFDSVGTAIWANPAVATVSPVRGIGWVNDSIRKQHLLFVNSNIPGWRRGGWDIGALQAFWRGVCERRST